jgi:hypothetical protein
VADAELREVLGQVQTGQLSPADAERLLRAMGV